MKQRCIIIDDEQHAIDALTDYINEVPELELIKTYTNPILALSEISSFSDIDIIFLDIDMPGLSGLELAGSIKDKTNFLVFTTSHQQYAVDAFEIRADHYLLKPISLAKFTLAINKLLEGPKSKIRTAEDNSIFVRVETKGKWIKINLDEVTLIEGEANYVHLHLGPEKHTVYLTMKEIEAAVKKNPDFIRVHKSYIVSKKFILTVSGKTITLKDESIVMIGETYKENFQNYVNGLKVKTSR